MYCRLHFDALYLVVRFLWPQGILYLIILSGVEGSWPALVTPYSKDGSVNSEMFRKLVDFHVENGSNGILVQGSTSESTLLTPEEKKSLIDMAVDQADGRIPVMCGISAPTAVESIENARYVKDAGADYGVLVQPGYVRPNQEALYDYFKTVAEGGGLPLVIYNNPSRTGVNLEPETIARLAQNDNIVALKEAGPNPYGVVRVIELIRGRFNVLCCDCPHYALLLPVMASGGKGTSNVTGNLTPREFVEMAKPWTDYEDVLKTREHYYRLMPLVRLMYAEINPVPLKAALNLLGAEVGNPRKPLQTLSEENSRLLEMTMKRLGILDEDSYQREFFSRA